MIGGEVRADRDRQRRGPVHGLTCAWSFGHRSGPCTIRVSALRWAPALLTVSRPWRSSPLTGAAGSHALVNKFSGAGPDERPLAHPGALSQGQDRLRARSWPSMARRSCGFDIDERPSIPFSRASL